MATRKDQATLTADERQKFVGGLLALKRQPSMLHSGSPVLSRYDDYVEVHIRSMMAMPAGWAHNGPAFFPWHRVLLLQLEREIQQAVGDDSVGIPYWDWTRTGSPQDTPLREDFLGGNGRDSDHQVIDGPFAFSSGDWTLNVVDAPGDSSALQRNFGKDFNFATGQIVDISLPDANAQQTALGLQWYDSSPWDMTASRTTSFRAAAEVNLHNLVHRWVGGFWLDDGRLMGGTMLQMSSPNDPVFWLHHCNLDRLWTAWQLRHPASARYLPYAGAAPGHNLSDTLIFGEHMPWHDMYTPEMTVDQNALGYTYDKLPEPPAPPTPVGRMVPLAAAIGPAQGGIRPLFPLASELEGDG